MQTKVILLFSLCNVKSIALGSVLYDQSCAEEFKCQCSVSEDEISCDYTDAELGTPFAAINGSRAMESFYLMHSINVYQLIPYFSRNVSFRMINIQDVKSLTTIDENAFWSSAKTLQTLQISSTSVNSSYSLFKAISQLVHLSQLILDDNQIEVIPDHPFSELQTQLTMVSITRNKIKYLSEFAVLPLISLDYIDLSSNSLEVIQNNSFTIKNNTLLKYRPLKINIRLNQIVDISETAFAGSDRPINLDISFNNLTKLYYKPYINFLQYENSKITIKGNKIGCDCDLKWLYDANKDFKSKVNGPLRCFKPDKRYFSELSEQDFANCTRIE